MNAEYLHQESYDRTRYHRKEIDEDLARVNQTRMAADPNNLTRKFLIQSGVEMNMDSVIDSLQIVSQPHFVLASRMGEYVIGDITSTHPQLLNEQELKKEGIKYKVGRAQLKDTGMGGALQENGLAKVLVDEQDNILGCHVIGPQASILIHESIVAMKVNGTIGAITNSVYIHPALSEWLQRAFFDVG